MDEYSMFQANQSIQKQNLEERIENEKNELNQRHKRERIELIEKHKQMTQQLADDFKEQELLGSILKEEYKKRKREQEANFLNDQDELTDSTTKHSRVEDDQDQEGSSKSSKEIASSTQIKNETSTPTPNSVVSFPIFIAESSKQLTENTFEENTPNIQNINNEADLLNVDHNNDDNHDDDDILIQQAILVENRNVDQQILNYSNDLNTAQKLQQYLVNNSGNRKTDDK